MALAPKTGIPKRVALVGPKPGPKPAVGPSDRRILSHTHIWGGGPLATSSAAPFTRPPRRPRRTISSAMFHGSRATGGNEPGLWSPSSKPQGMVFTYHSLIPYRAPARQLCSNRREFPQLRVKGESCKATAGIDCKPLGPFGWQASNGEYRFCPIQWGKIG